MKALIIFIWVCIVAAVIASIVLSVKSKSSRKKYTSVTPHQRYETKKNAYEESRSPIEETSHEGHSPYGRYAQNHEDRVGRTLITHPEPEPGYVVLNGVKRKIEDCRYL